MDLKDKKLALIDSIIHRQDESVSDEIAILLSPNSLSKLSQQDVIERSEKAKIDYHEGKVYSTEKLIKMAEKW